MFRDDYYILSETPRMYPLVKMYTFLRGKKRKALAFQYIM